MVAINAASISLSTNPFFALSSPNELLPTFMLKSASHFQFAKRIFSPSRHQVTNVRWPSHGTISQAIHELALDGRAWKGCDVLAEALRRQGITHVFGYPGEASMEILDALRRCTPIRNVFARHEQGSVFAAEGYARASGFPGVCITTSGPSVTNIMTGLADAYTDSIPLVVITGQIPSHLMGTGALQDTPVVDMTRPITKRNYLVTSVEEIPRIVKEAFFVAKSGRPGPVLIDIPMDIQVDEMVPDWDEPMRLGDGLPKPPCEILLKKIVNMIGKFKRPLLYIGGGCVDSSEELRLFVELTGIPVASTMMGLGIYPCSDDEFSLQMLGLYGTDHANYAVNKCDLLLAFGARFQNYATVVTSQAFASQAKIVHIDIDPAELAKNKQVAVSLCTDIKLALKAMNSMLKGWDKKPNFSIWRREVKEQKCTSNYRIMCGIGGDKEFEDVIHPWDVIQVLDELTDGNAIICTGAGENQVWATQFYTHKHPRHLLMCGGFGPMGFGLPAAIGAAIARPDAVVVDIDGDGSFLMNVQELATARAENLSLKIVILNNQHFGMVANWEDHFCHSKREYSFLGNPSDSSQIFPNMLKFADACDVPSARVVRKKLLRGAMQKMMDTPGPYLLDVILPLEEHALPTLNNSKKA